MTSRPKPNRPRGTPIGESEIGAGRRRVAAFVTYYNHVQLHSAIGYITPADKLAGLDEVIFAERDRELEKARVRRRAARQAALSVPKRERRQTTSVPASL